MQTTLFKVGTIITIGNGQVAGIVISETIAMFTEHVQKKFEVTRRRIPKDSRELDDLSRLTRDSRVAFISICATLNISSKHL